MDDRHNEILSINEISVLSGLVNFLTPSLPCKLPRNQWVAGSAGQLAPFSI